MNAINCTVDDNELAQVAISRKLLEQLVATGFIHSNECRCLNGTAKQVIWQTLLNNSVKWEY